MKHVSLPGAKVSPSVRRLRKRLRSARRWSVTAGTFGGIAAVMIPLHGLGALDAVWAAAFGGSAILAGFRWSDYRYLAKSNPKDSDELRVGGTSALALEAQTIAGALAGKLRQGRVGAQFRRSAAGPPFSRLESATLTLDDMAPHVPPMASEALTEGRSSLRTLRTLAHRIRSLEKAMSMSSPPRRQALEHSHQQMVSQLHSGVEAFEEMVGSVAQVLAEQSALEGSMSSQDVRMVRLHESTQKLHGFAEGISQMRELHEDPQV